jgi:hypothetical protein
MERRRDAPPMRGAGSDGTDTRPTVHPPFDPAQYARESEQKMRIADEIARDDAPVLDAVEEMSDEDAEEVYRARLGGDEQVVTLTRGARELLRTPRRTDEGFVLALVDGQRNVGDVIRLCELPRVSAMVALCDLLDAGILALRPPA